MIIKLYVPSIKTVVHLTGKQTKRKATPISFMCS